MSADAFGAMALMFGAVCPGENRPTLSPAPRNDLRLSTSPRASGATAPVLRQVSLGATLASLLQR